MRLLKKGSVKEVYALREPEGEETGEGRFVFTDSYSVFDWGEMPQRIPQKGEALCLIGAYFFEKLHSMGIRTHYKGLEQGGRIRSLEELEGPTRTMAVRLVRVLQPELRGDRYDYGIFEKERTNFLIPLEVIYRNSLPEGSSVFRRLREGSISLEDLGLREPPVPGQRLKEPILDVSTKLEATDRYITFEEARRIAGLDERELEAIKALTLRINAVITGAVRAMGLENEDGKVEFAFDGRRELMVVDVIGTPDECRFTCDGLPLSKEILRILYRRTPWYREVEEAKGKDPGGWKRWVSDPPALPDRAIELTSNLYKAMANALTRRRWFDVPPLEEVISELEGILRR